MKNVVDINSDFFADWNNFTAFKKEQPDLEPKTYEDDDGLGPQHVSPEMLEESNIDPTAVVVGPTDVEIEIPLVQKLTPHFVHKQLNLERKMLAITMHAEKLIQAHKKRIADQRKVIEKKRMVNIPLERK